MTTTPDQLRQRRRTILLTVTGLERPPDLPASWERDLLDPLLKDLLGAKRQAPETLDAPETERTGWVAHVRVSTAEQAESDLSLPAQQKAIREFASRHGATIDREYVEAGASGADPHRPVFNRLLGEALQPTSTIGTIVVHHTSRFTRDATHARVVKSKLRKAGVRVISRANWEGGMRRLPHHSEDPRRRDHQRAHASRLHRRARPSHRGAARLAGRSSARPLARTDPPTGRRSRLRDELHPAH